MFATWSELKYYTEDMWRSPPYENELRVELINGATIRLYGADNPDTLRGGTPFHIGARRERAVLWSVRA